MFLYGLTVPGFFRTVSQPVIAKWNKFYHRKPREYKYGNAVVNVLPGVYSPISSPTTPLLLSFIEPLGLNLKTVLDLGCGSGIVAKFCAQKGALVTASDICETALNELRVNAREHNDNIISVYSNLFGNLPFHFDYIFINPPFKPQKRLKPLDFTDSCGEEFEFFNTLFKQLQNRNIATSKVYMILPEEAEVFSISRRAQAAFLKLKTVKVWRQKGQKTVLYQITEDN